MTTMAKGGHAKDHRTLLLLAGLAALYAAIYAGFGLPYGLRMTVEALCYALIALGLTIQWGYAGLFNAGVMGFVAVGAFLTVLVSYPVNESFWSSDLPHRLGRVLLAAAAGIVLTLAAARLHRLGVPRRLRTLITAMTAGAAYLTVVAMLDPVARDIETRAGFIGGLGLPVWLGWTAGGAAAGLLAWFVGRICLGLRSDYLAIATLGIAEIVKALLKNADWLTRGTLTVSPLPWPVPTPNEIGFVAARAAYLALMATLVIITWALLERAWRAPWGRMMRAIRDNEDAAAAMGKNVNRRRLEVFVLGSLLMGLGGAALVTFTRIFDPAGFLPLNHTFLVWVMIILGGPGSNLGAVFGALFVYVIWVMSEPAALLLFDAIRTLGESLFAWQAPADLDSRALQARVFAIGLVITLVLRYAPAGIFPETVPRDEED
jgi:branched-chain amino acid transport system permease protein